MPSFHTLCMTLTHAGLSVVWLQQPPSQVSQYDTITLSVNVTAPPSYFVAEKFLRV